MSRGIDNGVIKFDHKCKAFRLRYTFQKNLLIIKRCQREPFKFLDKVDQRTGSSFYNREDVIKVNFNDSSITTAKKQAKLFIGNSVYDLLIKVKLLSLKNIIRVISFIVRLKLQKQFSNILPFINSCIPLLYENS